MSYIFAFPSLHLTIMVPNVASFLSCLSPLSSPLPPSLSAFLLCGQSLPPQLQALSFSSITASYLHLFIFQHPQPYSTSIPSSSSSTLSIKPSTATMSLYPSSSTHSASSSTHQRMPAWTSPLDKQVPLRGFEVPAETISDLKATASQKRKVAKVPSWQEDHGKPGFSECEFLGF